jgi:hypothetical protein
MGNGMVMAPVPSGPPTAAEQAAANTLVAQTTAAVAKYASLSAATAAGYVPATNPADTRSTTPTGRSSGPVTSSTPTTPPRWSTPTR